MKVHNLNSTLYKFGMSSGGFEFPNNHRFTAFLSPFMPKHKFSKCENEGLLIEFLIKSCIRGHINILFPSILLLEVIKESDQQKENVIKERKRGVSIKNKRKKEKEENRK